MDDNSGRPAGKRYYWLKLRDDFFNSKRIKKLRRLAGGDTYTIIYLKMQLLAMKTDGVLRWTGLEDDFASELALDLDEAPDNVAVTLRFLLSYGLAETDDNTNFFFPYAVENTGSETAAAQRMRDMRARNARNAVTEQRNNVTPMLRERYGEKEIELEKEKELERESDPEKKKDNPLFKVAEGDRGYGGKDQRPPAARGLSGEARERRIQELRDGIKRFRNLHFDAGSIYRLAAAEGISPQELDAEEGDKQ